MFSKIKAWWDKKDLREKGEIAFSLPPVLLAGGIGVVLLLVYLFGSP